jgi:hypothetical protein
LLILVAAASCGGGGDASREAGCIGADVPPAVDAPPDTGGEPIGGDLDAGTPADAAPDTTPDTSFPDDAGGCPTVVFGENFEGYAAGDPLAPAWQLVVVGPTSSARINLDAEGHGNAGSNRYVLFSNLGSEPDSVQISAATPPRDVRGCSAAVLTASVIVFSLEQSENDHAFVEVRANGNDWTPIYMPFPSPEFPPLISCRAGGQETGCVAWGTIQVEIPRVMMGPDLEVRFRLMTLTSVSDFFGFDDVTLAGIP